MFSQKFLDAEIGPEKLKNDLQREKDVFLDRSEREIETNNSRTKVSETSSEPGIRRRWTVEPDSQNKSGPRVRGPPFES